MIKVKDETKMKEPKTVLKHTRTITTYYLSDGNAHELFKKLEGFLDELTLPDSYEGGDVVAVTSEGEIDEVIDVQKRVLLPSRLCVDVGDLENSLEGDSIPYDITMEQWNERRQAKA